MFVLSDYSCIVSTRTCVWVCMCVCMYAWCWWAFQKINLRACTHHMHSVWLTCASSAMIWFYLYVCVCMCVCMGACMCVCMGVCVCVCIYIYIYIYVCINMYSSPELLLQRFDLHAYTHHMHSVYLPVLLFQTFNLESAPPLARYRPSWETSTHMTGFWWAWILRLSRTKSSESAISDVCVCVCVCVCVHLCVRVFLFFFVHVCVCACMGMSVSTNFCVCILHTSYP